jgi:hypothetical protein
MYSKEGMLEDTKYLFKFFNFVSIISGLILILYILISVYTSDYMSVFLSMLSPAVGSYLQLSNVTLLFFKEIMLVHIVSLLATLFLFLGLLATDSYDLDTPITNIFLVVNLIWVTFTIILIVILVLITLFMMKEKK